MQTKEASSQQLGELQAQLQTQQATVAAATGEAARMQSHVQELRQQLAAVEQELAERERSKQQVAAEVAKKQHALQITRGECASTQDKLSQVLGVQGVRSIQVCKCSSAQVHELVHQLACLPMSSHQTLPAAQH